MRKEETALRYFLMCCFEEKSWQRIPEAERDRIMGDYARWIEELDRSGGHLASAQLQPSTTATTLRSRGGKPVVTDGPFAETKEQLGGYHVIECRDLDEALAIASRIPTLPFGGVVEVRPFLS